MSPVQTSVLTQEGILRIKARVQAPAPEPQVPVESSVPREPPVTLDESNSEKMEYKPKILWPEVVGFLVLHLATLYGVMLMVTSAKILTTLWMWVFLYVAALGLTMGAHRLYTHRTFSANVWIRLVLVTLHTMTGTDCLWNWVRDHRQHHKYSDTDADPHNSTRGFFFSHLGWLVTQKHPLVTEKRKTIDMLDMSEDAMVMFQKKYYHVLFLISGIAFPAAVPCYFWNETLWNSFFVGCIARLGIGLNIALLVNSAAHVYGTRPYTRSMPATENGLLSFFVLGEGWHNYHHTFPWDYKTAEFGQYYNLTTTIIDYCIRKGWVYNVKYAKEELVRSHTVKEGDGSHPKYGQVCEN